MTYDQHDTNGDNPLRGSYLNTQGEKRKGTETNLGTWAKEITREIEQLGAKLEQRKEIVVVESTQIGVPRRQGGLAVDET